MAVITYTGTSGADVFAGPSSEDNYIIFGLGGGDTLTGNALADQLYGGFGDDVLDGAGGDDDFFVGANEGFDSYTGGEGFDRIRATADGVVIGIAALSGVEEISANGFSGVTIIGSNGGDVLDFSNIVLTGIERISGGAGADTIITGSQNDLVGGGTGADTIDAGAGDDTIFVGFGAGFDTVIGGLGNDTLTAINDNVIITLASLAGVETISSGGFGGVRVLFDNTDNIINLAAVALDGIDSVSGGGLNDTLTGNADDNVLLGGNGDDIIRGGLGNDTLDGGNGLDTLEGQQGDDTFLVGAGGSGRDIYRGGAGFDTVSGNADFAKLLLDGANLVGVEAVNSGGFANFSIEAAPGAIGFNLTALLIDEGDIAAIRGNFVNNVITGSRVADNIFGGAGDDRVNGGTGDDIIDGEVGNDTLDGGAGFDTLFGNADNDTLLGQGAADTLDGGEGLDILAGGTGLDTLTGGLGADTFRDTRLNLAGDTITDFEGLGVDRIQLTNVGPGGLALSYADGVLTVDPAGANNTINIALPGAFTTAGFSVTTDGGAGVFITYIL